MYCFRVSSLLVTIRQCFYAYDEKVVRNDLQLCWAVWWWLLLNAHQPWKEQKVRAPGWLRGNRRRGGSKDVHKFPDTPLTKRWGSHSPLPVRARLGGALVTDRMGRQGGSGTSEARVGRHSSFYPAPCLERLPLDFQDLKPVLYNDSISHPGSGCSVCGWA